MLSLAQLRASHPDRTYAVGWYGRQGKTVHLLIDLHPACCPRARINGRPSGVFEGMDTARITCRKCNAFLKSGGE